MNNISKTIPQILKENICTIFNLLNILIALFLALAGAWKNILFILIILINTIIGIIQEIKAKRQIERLTLLSLPSVNIIRDGVFMSITPSEVKKGDVFLLESGSVICCDCIIRSGSAEINESILTGESEPALKRTGDTLLSGSTVISGRCRAEASCDSENCFTSKISDEVKSTKQGGSELLSAMKRVTRLTGFFIVPLGIFMFIQAYFYRQIPFSSAVVSISAGLLGMLPKGLVLLISVSLAAGVVTLSKKNVLVRDLYSLENLAHCDVVCLDKTGTITKGVLTVERVFSDIADAEFQKLISAYLSCTEDNNSTFAALKNYFTPTKGYKCVSTVPFSSERKYSSVTLEDGRSFILGAPEKLCRIVPQEVSEIMAGGKRVILAGICRGAVLPHNITLVGMIVISDKIKKSAPSTIEYFYRQGIDVKIISGDNPSTASAAARAAGVKNFDSYIDMSEVKDEEILNIAEKYTVFGRVTPSQKKLLVTALQKHNHKIAMTGDGVNDILAMRCSDCGIAMGNGSDAARQTAQLVLLNSDLSALKDVISEGRRVINNITKSAGVFFIKTIYSILICLFCLLCNISFPFIPIQITLIDAIIEGYPAFFMSFERNDKKVQDSFLKSAVLAALPNAIAIFACFAAIVCMKGRLGLDTDQLSLIMYLETGFISLAGLMRASRPFNLRHAIAAVSSAVGFIAAVIMFSPFLQLPALSYGGAAVLIPLTAIAAAVLFSAYICLRPNSRRFIYRLFDSLYKRLCRRTDKQCVKHSTFSYGDNSSPEENPR